jgi:hypothetical protein
MLKINLRKNPSVKNNFKRKKSVPAAAAAVMRA